PQEVAAPKAPVAAGQLDGLSVLAIDNEPDILNGMRHLLENWHCDVITARDDLEAVQHLAEENKTPDIVVIDYHLDEGTGIEAVVRLRWKFGADLPALLVTADRSRAVRAEAAAKSIDMFNKPVKPAALRAHLARCRAGLKAAE
ncbi:MAG: response regulator, partial [Roseibium sp.]